MLLSHVGASTSATPHDMHRMSFASPMADVASSIVRAQALMRDGRHFEAASLLSQHGRRQDMAAADAARVVQILSECAQFCTGHSQDKVIVGIQMCHDAQTLAELTGLPPQHLLPVLLVHGQLQLSLGAFSEAIDMFQRVCYFDKSFGSYQPAHALMLASALRQAGQLRDAMSHASAAVQVLHAASIASAPHLTRILTSAPKN
jgi:tetratricopeptide (TPR) repeat protein